MVTVASEPLTRRYVARPVSLASCFHFCCFIALLIIPFIISYTSDSLWKKDKLGRERPEVHFQHRLLVIARDSVSGTEYMFSSDPALTDLMGTALRPMSLRVREEDADFDGRPEVLHASVTLPLRSGESVTGFTAFVGLAYNLQDTVRWSTNATAIVHHEAGAPGSSLQVYGDLTLRQADTLLPLSAREGPPILAGAPDARSLSDLLPQAIVSRYMSYGDAVHLTQRYSLWNAVAGTSTFTANMAIYPAPQLVDFQPRVVEMLKFGWIQYIAFFYPLYHALRLIKLFAAANQITPTRVVTSRPGKRLTDHDF